MSHLAQSLLLGAHAPKVCSDFTFLPTPIIKPKGLFGSWEGFEEKCIEKRAGEERIAPILHEVLFGGTQKMNWEKTLKYSSIL